MARKPNVERAEEQVTGYAFRAPGLWVESQANAFKRFDEVARRWLDRRQEALDATRQSLDEMRGSRDVGELMRIQSDWVFGSMRRLIADFGELSIIALNLAQGATTRMAWATESTTRDMAEAGRELATAGSKPRMRSIKQ
jgi:HAMP domain-containing protein